MHKDDRCPCSTKILLPYLFITPSKASKNNPTPRITQRTPRTNMAARSAVGLRTAAVSAHALRRPAPKWPLPLSVRLPRDDSWWACSLSASLRHGCRLHRSVCNSRLPVVAGQRSFPCWKLGRAGERCGVNCEREPRASAPAPDGEDGRGRAAAAARFFRRDPFSYSDLHHSKKGDPHSPRYGQMEALSGIC